MTGGGTGHGPHDVYPDGHQLTLQKIKNNQPFGSTNRVVLTTVQ